MSYMVSHLVPYPKPKAPQSQITILFFVLAQEDIGCEDTDGNTALPQALHGLAPFPLTRLSDRKNSLNMVSSEFERRHMKRQTNALSQITAGW